MQSGYVRHHGQLKTFWCLRQNSQVTALPHLKAGQWYDGEANRGSIYKQLDKLLSMSNQASTCMEDVLDMLCPGHQISVLNDIQNVINFYFLNA